MSDARFPELLTLRVPGISPVQLALFAAASGDHNPLHLDPDVARKAGFERPIVHGMLSMALAGRLFTERLGPACVRVLQTRFSGAALVNESLDFEARLDRVEGGRGHYSLRACNAAGGEVLSGTAEVVA